MGTDDKHGRGATRDRSGWPVRRYRLGEEPGDDLSAYTTPEQRVQMMWSLALDAWTLTGRELPSYTRAQTPVRRIPPAGDEAPEAASP